MIKKLITFIFYLFFLTCGDSQDPIGYISGDDGGGSDGGFPITDCAGYPLNTDCPTDISVDGIPGCAYFENYCSPSICVGGTSNFSETVAYCDCNGDYIPGIEPLNIEGDCSDISNTGCGQVDGCGACYGGTSGNLEYNDCDCNGDVDPGDCENSPPNTPGCALNICGCIGGNTGIESCPECPENFIISEQSTINQTICFPNNFSFINTTSFAGYFITSITADFDLVTTNCTNCSDGLSETKAICETELCDGSPCTWIEDDEVNECVWVGAFNGDVCVGAREWATDRCGGGVCEVYAYGGDNPNGYMESGDIPTFKIYDKSTNLYHPTTYNYSGNITWSDFGTLFIDELIVLPPETETP